MSDNGRQDPPSAPEPYEPPRIISEEVFETLTLTCGKTDPGTPTCDEPLGSLQNS
jgi:hypothetical protein